MVVRQADSRMGQRSTDILLHRNHEPTVSAGIRPGGPHRGRFVRPSRILRSKPSIVDEEAFMSMWVRWFSELSIDDVPRWAARTPAWAR